MERRERRTKRGETRSREADRDRGKREGETEQMEEEKKSKNERQGDKERRTRRVSEEGEGGRAARDLKVEQDDDRVYKGDACHPRRGVLHHPGTPPPYNTISTAHTNKPVPKTPPPYNSVSTAHTNTSVSPYQ
eukprot:1812240-Rhodomonas_salina.1